nr:FCD domain-containing protein [Brevibacterium daeguense]
MFEAWGGWVPMAGRRVSTELRENACARVREGSAPAEVAVSLGVSVASVRRWVARAAVGESLGDRPRQGRPRIQDTADQVVSAVLATAGPRIDSSDYSTRAVALATGLSQSVVARSMKSLSVPPAPPTAELRLIAAWFPVLVVGTAELPAASGLRHDVARERARSARSFSRRGAGVVSALRSGGLARWEQRSSDPDGREIPRMIEELGTRSRAERVIAFDPHRLLAPGAQQRPRHDREGRRVPAESDLGGTIEWRLHSGWEGFLAEVREELSTTLDIPGSLLRTLSSDVPRGLERLAWPVGMSDRPSTGFKSSDSAGPVPDSRWLPRENLSLTEQLALALRQEIIDSGYRAGDRIRASHLASRLELPRAAIEAALRRMIDDELLDGSRESVRIPTVTAADVIDLYAARQALGIVLLRALAARPRRHLVPVRQALHRVETVVRSRRGTEVDDADLRFQQELARASGLEQTARSFESLTLRLRMYISVLLLDYTPAAERIVLDDRRIVRALESGDSAAAEEAWRGKLDNAVRHMAGIAQHRGFDVALWTRLTAG